MHNDDHKILQILDQSACLSKSQLLGYMNRSLYPEELRAVELHLSSCSLCNDALEGFETIQNAEALIASMAPPALPAIVLPEKPAEKKEPEPQPAYVPSKKRSRAKVHAETAAQEHNRYNSNPQSIWFKTLGAAAALVIGFGLIWYFELGSEQDRNQENIAVRETTAATPSGAATDSGSAPQAMLISRDSLNAVAAQKVKDSVYLATLRTAKLKQQQDSLANRIAANERPDSVARSAAAKTVAVEEKVQADMQEAPVNARKPADTQEPVAMVAKKKEEPKTAKSDFELGMEQYKQNNFASALLYFKTAESNEKDPRHWEAVYLSGMSNKALNKKRKAIKYFERVADAKVPQSKAAQKQLDAMRDDK